MQRLQNYVDKQTHMVLRLNEANARMLITRGQWNKTIKTT